MGARTINLHDLCCHGAYGESSELLAGRLFEIGGIPGLYEHPVDRGCKIGGSSGRYQHAGTGSQHLRNTSDPGGNHRHVQRHGREHRASEPLGKRAENEDVRTSECHVGIGELTDKMHAIFQTEPRQPALQDRAKRPLPNDNPLEGGQVPDQQGGRFHQGRLVLFRGKRAEAHGNLSLFRETETCADVGASRGSQLGDVDGGGDDGKAFGGKAVTSKRLAHGSRDRDHALRAVPEQLPPERKGYPAGGDKRSAAEPGTHPCECECVRIVGVEDCSSVAELAEYGGEDARVEAGLPPDRTNSHTGRAKATGQLGISRGDDRLIDATAGELAGQ
jgi:hypothetical protein